MKDPILNARLDVLDQELILTNDQNAWRQKLCLKKLVLEDEELSREWDKFTSLVGDELGKQRNVLKAIRIKLEEIKPLNDAAAEQVLSQAWTDYGSALKRSQTVFREFLEFIGGLILRDKEFDSEICDVADELIKSCSQLALTNASIAVPAARDALTRTVGLMVRVRFPDWTVWTLPSTAYEYGHLVLNELNKFKDSIAIEVDKWLKQDPEFKALAADKQAPEESKQLLRERAEIYVKEFLADIFATYMMGPAYACSAILLRFDPAGSSVNDSERPDDIRRGFVVLEVLNGMNTDSPAKPYTLTIKYLEDQWKATKARVKSPVKFEDWEKARLKALVDGWHGFRPKFSQFAKYPDNGPDGWNVAAKWAQDWLDQSSNNVPLKVPQDITHLSKLRDVLNAAWICRIPDRENPNSLSGISDQRQVSDVEQAARSSCNKISLKIIEQKQSEMRRKKAKGFRK